MNYLDAFVNEVLRVYGPVLGVAPRVAVRDHKLDHIEIRKGTILNIGTVFNNFNSDYFKNPHDFKPERWLDGGDKNVDTFTFLPFSGGPRSCIGNMLAKVEVKIMIISFLNVF